MKLAILLARSSEDRAHASVVERPMPYDQAARIFKGHVARREMPDGCAKAGFNVLELWTSAGRAKRHKFSNPGLAPSAGVTAAPASAPRKKAAKAAPVQPEAPAADLPQGDALLEKIAARLEARETVAPGEIGQLSEAQLRTLAARYEIPVPDGADKAALVALFVS
jgi:hypothetical protein